MISDFFIVNFERISNIDFGDFYKNDSVAVVNQISKANFNMKMLQLL